MQVYITSASSGHPVNVTIHHFGNDADWTASVIAFPLDNAIITSSIAEEGRTSLAVELLCRHKHSHVW